MKFRTILKMLVVLTVAGVSNASEWYLEESGRGKKKKIALLVYFADIVLKKLFVLKLIYAFVFWVVIHKAGYFLSWFIGYLKEQKHEHHEYYIPQHQPHYGPPHDPYRRQSSRYNN